MTKKKANLKNINEIRSEILAFRGRLYPDLRFELCRSYSTHEVKVLQTEATEGYRLELVDEHERVINRGAVSVVPVKACEAGGERYSRVWSYIGLSEGAEEIKLYRDDLLLVSLRIPKRPTLSLARRAVKVEGKGRVKLALRYSTPSEGAFMQVAYQWSEQAWRSVGFYEPAKSFSVDISQLPPGNACRLLVLYSNGLRSVGTATRYFSVPRKGPVLAILRPKDGGVFAPWVPVELEGQIVDDEEGPARDDEYVWLLDGSERCTGPQESLEQLPQGKHTLTLRYGRSKQAPTVSCEFTVRRPKKLPGLPANEWASTPPSGDR